MMVLRTCVEHPTNWPWFEWPVGRLLFLPLGLRGHDEQRRHVHESISREKEADALQGLSDRDVLCVELFKDNWVTKSTELEPLPNYDETMELIQEVGPSLRGVLIGHHKATEVTYRELFGAWQGNAIGNLTAIAEFILQVGSRLRAMGITPWFAPMDWDIIQDAHKGGGRIREALNAVEATGFIACGYTLIPGAYVVEFAAKLHGMDQLRAQCDWSGKGFRLPAPDENLPVLRDYLHDGNFYAGLGGPPGVRHGNIKLMSDYGFRGFSTKIPEGERAALVEELGEWWA